MALPCCPPFAQGGLFLCPGQHNRQRQRKERVQRHAGRTAILRCRAGQLNESRLELLGFTIPPAWLCHAVPPLHKGGFFFARVDTTGPSSHNPHGCSVALGPYRAPPGARKKSGKNLVFPRDPAAAPADYLQVISALCRNNTPPKLQKIPRRKPPGDFFAAASAAADALDHQISGLASAGRALG